MLVELDTVSICVPTPLLARGYSVSACLLWHLSPLLSLGGFGHFDFINGLAGHING